jgi:hypothetical protein
MIGIHIRTSARFTPFPSISDMAAPAKARSGLSRVVLPLQSHAFASAKKHSVCQDTPPVISAEPIENVCVAAWHARKKEEARYWGMQNCNGFGPWMVAGL